MCCRQLIVAGALVWLAAAPAAAQGLTWKGDLFVQKKPAPLPKVDWSARASADREAQAKPQVICGMTVVPGDPRIDPGMAQKPKDSGARVQYTLKVVEPTVCKTSPQR